jgi:hypothetical protein
MTKTMRGRVLAAALLLMPVIPVFTQQNAPPAYGQPPQPFVWWKSEPFRKELGITTEQAARIDKVWETTRPELRQEWDELSRLEAKLSRMIQADMDEAALSRQIDRVETARANTNKSSQAADAGADAESPATRPADETGCHARALGRGTEKAAAAARARCAETTRRLTSTRLKPEDSFE